MVLSYHRYNNTHNAYNHLHFYRLYSEPADMLQLIRGLAQTGRNIPRGGVVTIGNFDGVHRGHQHVLRKMTTFAKAQGIPSIVVTFEPQPQAYFAKIASQPSPIRLIPFREKYRLLKEAGVDAVFVIRFDTHFSQLSAEAFIQLLLVEQLQAKHVIVGEDFHFGYGRAGTIALLQQSGQVLGFTVESVPDFLYDNERISSSRIRRALMASDFALAEKLLGYPWYISGHVTHGDKRGRTLGFPTANISLTHFNPPVHGIYSVEVAGLAAQAVQGVASVGVRPAVCGKKKIVEVYLLDFAAEIYGRRITIYFCEKLRDEAYFATLPLLCQQMTKDVANARVYFAAKTHHQNSEQRKRKTDV